MTFSCWHLQNFLVCKHDQTCYLHFSYLTLARGVVVNPCSLQKLDESPLLAKDRFYLLLPYSFSLVNFQNLAMRGRVELPSLDRQSRIMTVIWTHLNLWKFRYHTSSLTTVRHCCRLFWWTVMDLNHCASYRTDLQSVAFNHSANCPKLGNATGNRTPLYGMKTRYPNR